MRRLTLIPCILLLLCGCRSTNSDKEAQLFSALPIDQPVGELFAAGEWPAQEWWSLFGDPQLSALIEKALKDNPSLKKAESKVSLAEELSRKERAALFPTLSGEGQVNWQYLAKNGLYRAFAPVFPGNIHQLDVSVNFYYDFDIWGKNRKLYEAALGRAKAEAAESALSTLVITTSVANVYFELQADLLKRQIIADNLDRRKAFLSLKGSRSGKGLDNEQQPLPALQELLRIEQEFVRTQKAIELDHHLLKILMGQNPDNKELFEQPTAFFDRPFPLPQNLGMDLLARRPDLMAQIWRVEAAAKEVRAAKTDFYPNIDLTAFQGYESLSWNGFFAWANRMQSLLPAIHLPIFTGGRITANLRAKHASYQEAIHTYNETLLKALKEVVDELSIFKAVSIELELQTQVVLAAKSDYDLEKKRFEEGLIDYLGVILLEEKWLKERLLQVDLSYGRLLSILNLIKALGGGYHGTH